MRNTLFATTAIAACLLLPAAVGAQQQQGDVPQEAQQFIDQAAVNNMFEIESSQLALEQAQNEDVQQFAEQMVEDHQAVGDDLEQITNELGVQPPQDLDEQHQQKLEQLQQASGEQFDSQYIQGQVEAHQQAVDLYQQYSEQGQVQQLTQFAQDTLPILESHLERAQELEQQMMGAAGAKQQQQQQ